MKTNSPRFRASAQSLVTLSLLLLWLSLMLMGCAATSLDVSLNNDFTAVATTEPAPVSIGVEEFIDSRPQAMGNDGKTRLSLIPGVFWLRIDSDLPEIYTAFSSFKSKPLNETAARATTRGLILSGLAHQALYLPDNPRARVDYRLEGNLRRTLIKETGYYYGSAVYVWLPRILGAPYVSYDMALEIQLYLREAQTGRLVWQGVITGQRADKYLNIYQIANGRDGKHLIAYHFADILAQGLEQVIPDMRAALLQTRKGVSRLPP